MFYRDDESAREPHEGITVTMNPLENRTKILLQCLKFLHVKILKKGIFFSTANFMSINKLLQFLTLL
jgi:hypothetical protein